MSTIRDQLGRQTLDLSSKTLHGRQRKSRKTIGRDRLGDQDMFDILGNGSSEKQQDFSGWFTYGSPVDDRKFDVKNLAV